MEDIFHLIREGNSYKVRSWLDATENDFNQTDDHGFSLLHWACWDGHLNIVEMLVGKGSKINSINKCEDTPLHCASQNNHLDVVFYLLKNKANIHATNIHGNTTLHYACHFDYEALALELIKGGLLVNQLNRYNQTPISLCREPLKNHILYLAQTNGIEFLNPRPFIEDQNSRWSKDKMKESNLNQNGMQQSDINIDELPVEKMVDSNHGGTTWKGFWQGSEVIIKVLKVKETTQRIAGCFNQECKKLRIFNSANILPVLGSCISFPDLILVNQFMPYGSLFNILHEQADLIVDQNYVINFAINIAKGMDFLHSLEPSILNFHLNSKHVMIDEDLVAKINMSDYSFSFCDKNRVYNPAWMAPEGLRKKLDESGKKSADMWSFAIILWELITKVIPFQEYSPMQCGISISKESLRVELPNEMSNHMKKLIRICMNEDPGKRPKFEMILPILEKLRNSSSN